MKAVIINGEYWLCDDDPAHGWHGVKITHAAYDALRECEIEEDKMINLNSFEKEIEAQ